MIESPSRVLLQYFRTIGQVQLPGELTPTGWPAVAGPMGPDSPAAISFMDYGKLTAVRHLRGSRLVYPRVQVMIRSPDYDAAWDKGSWLEVECDRIGTPTTEQIEGFPGVYGVGSPTVVVRTGTYIIQAAHVEVPMNPVGFEKDQRRFLFGFHVRLTFRT